MADTTASIAEGLGLALNSLPPSKDKDPEQSSGFWQYYQCVAPQGVVSFSMSKYICSKTRVPFFEMAHHRYNVRAPAILPDNLQRQWIWWSNPNVAFWPPGTR